MQKSATVGENDSGKTTVLEKRACGKSEWQKWLVCVN
jgi:hypothetical protein